MGVIKININTIVNYINERLAGEQLLYSQLLVFLDGTIDDINQALNSNFPAFSEFSEKDENYPDYNFFPDRYIRTVVVTGACAKFYICDEEGAAVAGTLGDVELTHTEGIVTNGACELLWVAPIARYEMRNK